MFKTDLNLNVFFQEPFWIGIFEKRIDGSLSVCKVTFGSEPKDYEVYEYILNNWLNLSFSPSIEDSITKNKKVNPKRIQRTIKKQLNNLRTGTKSQQALSLQHEERKISRNTKKKEQNEEIKKYKYDLKQQKKKEKHRGR